MSGIQDVAEPLFADMSVVLRRGQVGVTEQLLHGAQVGPTVEQVCGERVAQRVWVGRCARSSVEEATRARKEGRRANFRDDRAE